MKPLLSFALALGILAACPQRAHPAPLAPYGETIGTFPFTIAEFDTGGGLEYLTVGYETEAGFWMLEEIPVGYALVPDTKQRMTMVEFLHTPCPNCTGEYFRSSWMSGGIETEAVTPRIDQENRASWRRRHRANVNEMLKDFPVDPPPPQQGSTCATPHHQGGPAELLTLESGDLEASHLPPVQTAMLIRSALPASQSIPFGQGYLCLHPLYIVREQTFDTGAGLRVLTPDTGALYQVIFRDRPRCAGEPGCPLTTANTTNVVDTRTPL